MTGKGRPSTPFFYRFVRDMSGQSEAIAVILLLAITIFGSAAVVVFGSQAISDTESNSKSQRIEHTMTLMDSRGAMVALGDSEVQTVKFQTGSQGGMEVREESGWIRVVHKNYTGSASEEVIYNETFGSVVYVNGDTEIAYEGGGVWRKRGNTSRMVSPPEFHYREATLTLPVIRVNGNSSGAGATKAVITQKEQARRIFPNATAPNDGANEVGARYNNTEEHYVNPVENGSVNVTVHSQYYKAWADFFRSRSDGDVTVHDSNKTVTVELITKGVQGKFDMPAEGNGVRIGGMDPDDHTLENFTITLYDDDSDSADFSNLKWSMWAEEGQKQFELFLQDGSGSPCSGGNAELTVYYSDDGGSTYHAWRNETLTYQCGNFDGDPDTEKKLVVNFTGTTLVEYQSISSSDLHHFSLSGSSVVTNPTFSEHSSSVSWESESYTSGDRIMVNNTTNHYMALMGPSFDLNVDDKSSDTVNEDKSAGEISYPGGDKKFITFLHITENELEVRIE